MSEPRNKEEQSVWDAAFIAGMNDPTYATQAVAPGSKPITRAQYAARMADEALDMRRVRTNAQAQRQWARNT